MMSKPLQGDPDVRRGLDNGEFEPVGAALVVGGGIVGMQSALDLAGSGFKVYLVERSPAIGGNMARLDKTFPTNDCSMCTMSPRLVECGRHDNIEILTGAELVGLTGEAGRFEASVERRARLVDPAKCMNCGSCVQSCPQEVPNEFDAGLSSRAAIYKPYPQAFPNSYAIDGEQCLGCGSCRDSCPADAIDLEMEDEELKLPVGAVILTTGYEPFDASRLGEFGWGRYPDVVTGLQLERMLSASGPGGGHFQRPSNGVLPGRVAWLQCVGSRDRSRGQGWCSSVCCMYATKQTLLVKEHHPEMEATVFYIDLRAFGKDFEKYWERAKTNGVRYERSMVSGVREKPDTKQLKLKYRTPQGELKEDLFDLVVLSVGLAPAKGTRELAQAAGVDLDEKGFILTKPTHPTGTSRPGVFAAGAVVEPKDIPQAVAEASAAAAEAARLLAPARGSLARTREYPAEHDVYGTGVRTGVFVCHCGINIASVVDIPGVVGFARALPGVVYAAETLYACSQDNQATIRDAIVKQNLNRVVVASCSPRTHEPLFQETMREAGLNANLFEMANIRDQCSWVHQGEPRAATDKAKDLVHMAVAKVGLATPVYGALAPVTREALVVGGGVAGLTAAQALAGQGYPVHLVEKTARLGGTAARIGHSLQGQEVGPYLANLVEAVQTNPLIKVYSGVTVSDVSGFVGNFTSTLSGGQVIRHGVAVVATGGREYKPSGYMYGQDRRVLTHLELDAAMAAGDPRVLEAKSVVLIQCVGSREPERPYCSRVCCSKSVRLALSVKEKNPGAKVYILYRDIRTYGFYEDLYAEAREKGVIFLRFEAEDQPRVGTKDGVLQVTAKELVLGVDVVIDADLVGLAAAILPGDNADLARFFKLPLNQEGFFLEAHMKLRPVDFSTDGVFMCGLAHGPKNLAESIAQAQAAAGRAGTVLARPAVVVEGKCSVVNQQKCVACGVCELVCPVGAVTVDLVQRVSVVNEAICKGCGACVASCRSGALNLKGCTDEQLMAMLEAVCGDALSVEIAADEQEDDMQEAM